MARKIDTTTAPEVLLLSCGIGRGHPFYLDGIQAALAKYYPYIKTEFRTVFDLAGPPTRFGWGVARTLYFHGSQGGLRTRLYQLLRDPNQKPMRSAIFSLGLESEVAKYREAGSLIIVDHPILAACLSAQAVWYQHGELVAPPASLVAGCERILVPTPQVAAQFGAEVRSSTQIEITGICLEEEIEGHHREWAQNRNERLQNAKALTVGVFSSGAEPDQHLKIIMNATQSLSKNGHTVILFARGGGKLAKLSRVHIERRELGNVQFVVYRTRAELHALSMAHWSQFDCFFAPYHERVNWAVGAGLPLFGYLPTVGPFASLNREYVHVLGVATDITEATSTDCGAWLNQSVIREHLGRSSFGGSAINSTGGFRRIAELVSRAVRMQ